MIPAKLTFKCFRNYLHCCAIVIVTELITSNLVCILVLSCTRSSLINGALTQLIEVLILLIKVLILLIKVLILLIKVLILLIKVLFLLRTQIKV